MTVVWAGIAFVAGALFWHHVGAWMFRKVGLNHSMRADLIKGLSTDLLLALRSDATDELRRRARVTEEAGL
jgi:hypothetical protein